MTSKVLRRPEKPLAPHRLVANRRNAQRSTGRRTARGKARVRINAQRHGLYAQNQPMAGEERREFEELLAGIRLQHQPTTSYEHALVARLASLLWRLARVPAAENALYEKLLVQELEPGVATISAEELWARAFVAGSNESALNRIARYEASLQRDLARTQRALFEIQRQASLGLKRARWAGQDRGDIPEPQQHGPVAATDPVAGGPEAQSAGVDDEAQAVPDSEPAPAPQHEPAARIAPDAANQPAEKPTSFDSSDPVLAALAKWPVERAYEAMRRRLGDRVGLPSLQGRGKGEGAGTARRSTHPHPTSPLQGEESTARKPRPPLADQADINTDVFDWQK